MTNRIFQIHRVILFLPLLLAGCASPQARISPAVAPAPAAPIAQKAEALERFMIARLNEREGEIPAAVDEMARAVALDPASPFLHTLLGELYYRTALRISDAEMKSQFLQKAAAKGQDALLINPHDEAALRLLANVYLASEDTYNSVNILTRLAGAKPDKLDVIVEVAHQLIELGQLAHALPILERARLRWPVEPQILYLLGIAHAQVGEYAKAEEELLLLLTALPNQAEAFAKLGLLYEKMGRNQEAITQYENALALESYRHDVRMNYADLLLKSGRLTDAATQYQLLNRIPIYKEWAQTMQGHILLQTEKPAEAMEIFQRLARENPDNLDIMFRIAFTHEALGNWADAAASYEQVLTLRPTAWRALDYLFQTYVHRGLTQQGLKLVDDYVQKYPTDVELMIVYARILNQLDRYEDAARILQKFLRTNPRHEELLFTYAATLEQMGEVDRASKQFRRLIAINPTDARALNYYGYMLADADTRLDEAKHAIERAVKIAPDVPEYWDSLGWVYFRLGDFANAVKYLNKAIELGGEDTIIYEHLGDAYSALGLEQQARDSYREALAMDKDNPRLKRKLSASSSD